MMKYRDIGGSVKRKVSNKICKIIEQGYGNRKNNVKNSCILKFDFEYILVDIDKRSKYSQ